MTADNVLWKKSVSFLQLLANVLDKLSSRLCANCANQADLPVCVNIYKAMKRSDDYRQPDANFPSGDTRGDLLSVHLDTLSRNQAVERSFETQSGYMVLIKQLGSRYALSFKRQIGTPPTSSIFLTSDEAR